MVFSDRFLNQNCLSIILFFAFLLILLPSTPLFIPHSVFYVVSAVSSVWLKMRPVLKICPKYGLSRETPLSTVWHFLPNVTVATTTLVIELGESITFMVAKWHTSACGDLQPQPVAARFCPFNWFLFSILLFQIFLFWWKTCDRVLWSFYRQLRL